MSPYLKINANNKVVGMIDIREIEFFIFKKGTDNDKNFIQFNFKSGESLTVKYEEESSLQNVIKSFESFKSFNAELSKNVLPI
jgi:hypothetical protein